MKVTPAKHNRCRMRCRAVLLTSDGNKIRGLPACRTIWSSWSCHSDL